MLKSLQIVSEMFYTMCMTKTKTTESKTKKIINKVKATISPVVGGGLMESFSEAVDLNGPAVKNGLIAFSADNLNPISTTIKSYKTNSEAQDDLQAARNIADYLVKNNKMKKEVNFDENNRITTYSIQIFDEK